MARKSQRAASGHTILVVDDQEETLASVFRTTTQGWDCAQRRKRDKPAFTLKVCQRGGRAILARSSWPGESITDGF